jgi:hypothetical protein
MYINYTFFSQILNSEETVTILLPEIQTMNSENYSLQRIHEGKAKFPLLVAMGDEGTANTWLSRCTNIENDINSSGGACGIVLVRGIPYTDNALAFVGDELPMIMCASFPFDSNELTWYSCLRSGAYADALAGRAPYKQSFCGESDAGAAQKADGSCKDAFAQLIHILAAKEQKGTRP